MKMGVPEIENWKTENSGIRKLENGRTLRWGNYQKNRQVWVHILVVAMLDCAL